MGTLIFLGIIICIGLWLDDRHGPTGATGGGEPLRLPDLPVRHWTEGFNYNPGPGPYGGQSK